MIYKSDYIVQSIKNIYYFKTILLIWRRLKIKILLNLIFDDDFLITKINPIFINFKNDCKTP